MIDYQATVNAIRTFLSQPTRRKPAAGEQWARQYAEACAAANERLYRCADYIRQGLVGEAVDLSEAPPDLLDMVAALDFRELDDWRTLCQQHDWPAPAALEMDAAAALNEAYNRGEGLQGLLGQHRLLALARAPLGRRVAVVRRLAVMDAQAQFWKADQQKLEQARLDEIRGQVSAAVGENDGPALEALLSELNSPEWCAPVPADLRTKAQTALTALQRQRAGQTMEELLNSVHEAYGRLALDETREGLQRMHALAEESQSPMSGTVQEAIAPMEAWVAAEEQSARTAAAFQGACTALEAALDTGQATAPLRRLYQEAQQYGVPISEELRARYAALLTQRKRADARRRKIAFAGAAVAAILLIAAAVLGFLELRRRRRLARYAAALTAADIQLRTNGNRTAAQQLITRVRAQGAWLSQSSAIKPLLLRTRRELRQDLARRRRFTQALMRIKRAGLKKPDLADLAMAARLARTQAEKRAVDDWQIKFTQIEAQRRAALLRRQTVEARQLVRRIQRTLTRSALRANAPAWGRRLRLLQKRYQAIAALVPHASGPLSPPLRQAHILLQNQERRRLTQTYRKAAYQRLLDVTSVSDYRRSAAAFRAAAPASAFSNALSDNVRQLPALRAFWAWGKIVAGWGGHMTAANRADAQAREKQVRAFLRTYPKITPAPAVRRYAAYLHQFITATGPRGPLRRNLYGLLHNPLVHSLYTLHDSAGRRYYVPRNPHIARDSIGLHFRAIVRVRPATPQIVYLYHGATLPSRKPQRSGQSRFAWRASGLLRVMGPDGWQTIALRTLAMVIKDPMNPAVRGLLADNLLTISRRSDGPFLPWRQLRPVYRRLESLKLGGMNWLDPKHPPSAGFRKRVARILKPLGRINHLIAVTKMNIKQACRAGRYATVGVGILLHRPKGWRLSSVAVATAGDRAVALAGPNAVPVVVGNFAHGKWTLDQNRLARGGAAAAENGALVFICNRLP